MRKSALTAGVTLLFVLSSFAGKNLADYPLQIKVIESHWHRHRFNGIESVDGWGRGDVIDGASIRGFDFTYESSGPFERTVGDAHYLAKWKKELLKMEMVVGEIGSPDKYQTYDLKTTLRDDVYVRQSGGAVAVSQQEYKDKWAK
jgi:hypothetical protein